MVKTKALPIKFFHILIIASLGLLGGLVEFDLWTNGVVLLCVYAMAIYSWIAVTRKITSLYLMFLIYCMLSNAAHTLLYTFGITFKEFFDIYLVYDGTWINKMISFQSMCVAFLAIGALLAYKPAKEELSSVALDKEAENGKNGTITLDIADIGYLILLAVMFCLYIAKFFDRTSMDYQQFFYGDTSGTGVDLRVAILFYAFLYVSYYNHVNDSFRKFIYISTVALAFLVMSVGTRSLAIPMILGLLFVRSMTNKPFKKMSAKTILKWTILAIALLYILQAFKFLRGYSISEWNGEVFAQAFGVGVWQGLVNIFAEMGGSARCIILTMMEVDKHNVEQEGTIIYAMLKMFVPVDMLSAVGVDLTLDSLSYWITDVGGGQKGTGAFGYSIIGEMYLNFGKLGWIGMFGLGFIWVKLEKFVKWLVNKGHKIAGMGIVYLLAYSVFLARAETSLIGSIGRWAFYILLVSVFMVEILHTRITMNMNLGKRGNNKNASS